ncbi:hypothetical protein [Streptomyces albidoflavus]|uniref:hypothetical protein n=1 Tax=Streptomyces albidoflavus TaxID=1886 RepID=UPI00344F61F7
MLPRHLALVAAVRDDVPVRLPARRAHLGAAVPPLADHGQATPIRYCAYFSAWLPGMEWWRAAFDFGSCSAMPKTVD